MRIYLNRQGIYTRQTVLFSRYRCSRPARCCVFIRGKHPVCGEPLFCLSANPDSLSELCGFHIDHRSRSFLLQVSGVSSRLSFCCTSLVSGFIIHDEGGFVYSQSVQQMRRTFAPKIQKTGIHGGRGAPQGVLRRIHDPASKCENSLRKKRQTFRWGRKNA